MGEETAFMLEEANEGAEPETFQKAFRRRKKQLYQSIRKQMEFYFSDSNLTKDRFLGNLLKEDPCVDLSIFTRFNKIRALTTDISDLAKALKKSELLSVTEDGTKVFRTKPVQHKDNIDDCTIYVEQLPPDADHDWLRNVFSSYGNVAYVSIPKYRTSGKIKGFGFVEFETPEEASKTLEAFGARGCRLSSEIAPDKLCSIATFEADETGTNQSELTVKEDKKQQNDGSDSSPHKRKRKSSHKEGIETNQSDLTEKEDKKQRNGESDSSPQKRRRKSSHKEDVKDHESEHFLEDESKLRSTQLGLAPEEESVNEQIDPDSTKNQKKLTEEQCSTEVKKEESAKRKRKKKHGDTLPEEENEDNIASKRIKVEEDLTDMQEECAPSDQSVKKKRKREAEEENRESSSAEEEHVSEERNQNLAEECDSENVEEGETKRKRKRKKKKNKKDKQDTDASSLQILSKKEWKRLRNKYLDLQRAKMKCLKQYLGKQRWSNQMQQSNTDVPEPEVQVSQPRITYTPGTIVHAVLEEPVMDIRKFKADTKAMQDVQYVDVTQGANEAYIRCGTAESAKQLASSNPWVSSEVLQGEEETTYWDKIMEDRKMKFSNKIRTKQRGRDKILRRAERELGKHMKFDE